MENITGLASRRPTGISEYATMHYAAAAILLATLVTLLSPGQSRAHLAAADLQRLQKDLEAIRVEHNVPAMALVVVGHAGIAWSAVAGVTDRSTGDPVTPETVFRIGSITKILTAAALVQVARRDHFDLDDPLTKHISAQLFFNPWRDEQPITVVNLLEHTSGFRDWNKAEFDHNDATPATLEQGLAFSPRSRTARWEPGMHPVYSNSNYGLAGLVLERVAAQSYEDTIRKNLFDPLEMRSATSLLERTSALAKGHDQSGNKPIAYWHMIQRPAAAINAKPVEMAALVTMLLNRGLHKDAAVFSAAEIDRIETPTTSIGARNGLRFGYGLGIYPYYQDGFLFFGHGGDGDGFISRFAYCRDLGLGYFVTINSANQLALDEMRWLVEETFTRGHDAPQAPAPVILGKDLLQHYSGHYRLAAWRFDWESPESIEGKRIVVRPGPGGTLVSEDADGEQDLLIAVNRRHFRRSDEQGATSGFFEEGGKLFFQENDNWVKVADLDTSLPEDASAQQ